MKQIDHIDPGLLIVTDPPSSHTVSDARDTIQSLYLSGRPIPPVLMVWYGPRRYLILDGHSRAYIEALRGTDIAALLLQSNSDAQAVLQLEHQRDIPPFPHRRFLMGQQTLRALTKEAHSWAARYGFVSIADLLHLDLNRLLPQKPTERQAGRTSADRGHSA
jgi:hypothetical protein